MTCSIRAASSTVRVMGPALSSTHDSGSTPALLTRPYVGFRPTHPHREAGIRMLPPVSVPVVATARPAAIAAPDPPLEPPGITSRFHGLWVVPKWGLSVVTPNASSCVFNLPSKTDPAYRSLRAAVESTAGTRSARI